MENFKADLVEVLSDMIQAEFKKFGEGEEKLNNVLEMIEEIMGREVLQQASFKRRDENNGEFCKAFCSVLDEIQNALWTERETKAEAKAEATQTQAQKEQEEKAQKEQEEKAQKEQEEKAQKEQEEKAQKEQEEKAQKEQEEKAQKEQEEKAQKLEEVKATITEKEFIKACDIIQNKKITKNFKNREIFEAVRKYHGVTRDQLTLNYDLFKVFERLTNIIEILINN